MHLIVRETHIPPTCRIISCLLVMHHCSHEIPRAISQSQCGRPDPARSTYRRRQLRQLTFAVENIPCNNKGKLLISIDAESGFCLQGRTRIAARNNLEAKDWRPGCLCNSPLPIVT